MTNNTISSASEEPTHEDWTAPKRRRHFSPRVPHTLGTAEAVRAALIAVFDPETVGTPGGDRWERTYTEACEDVILSQRIALTEAHQDVVEWIDRTRDEIRKSPDPAAGFAALAAEVEASRR